MAFGVIGNTGGFDPLIQGSSPWGPTITLFKKGVLVLGAINIKGKAYHLFEDRYEKTKGLALVAVNPADNQDFIPISFNVPEINLSGNQTVILLKYLPELNSSEAVSSGILSTDGTVVVDFLDKLDADFDLDPELYFCPVYTYNKISDFNNDHNAATREDNKYSSKADLESAHQQVTDVITNIVAEHHSEDFINELNRLSSNKDDLNDYRFLMSLGSQTLSTLKDCLNNYNTNEPAINKYTYIDKNKSYQIHGKHVESCYEVAGTKLNALVEKEGFTNVSSFLELRSSLRDFCSAIHTYERNVTNIVDNLLSHLPKDQHDTCINDVLLYLDRSNVYLTGLIKDLINSSENIYALRHQKTKDEFINAFESVDGDVGKSIAKIALDKLPEDFKNILNDLNEKMKASKI